MSKTTTILLTLLTLALHATSKVSVTVDCNAPQAHYAASRLDSLHGDFDISIGITPAMPAEGFTITRLGRHITISGNDGPGCIYGANRLLEAWQQDPTLASLPPTLSDAPQMVLRGACVGLQKTVYLPGHRVYEYPYTPENFPWFYDKELWLSYLDLLAASNMNTVYLWNGHPFASLVKVADYPFAPEVDDATMALNQQMFAFLVDEADRRGIRVIQMFYNIILSKPFADHYGLKTQDRNRPITPLVSDYTRKSIAAFVEKYPRVGFLVCLGEAMSGTDTDIEWMTQTVIPGICDGLKASGRTDTPPVILRSHDTDGPAVLRAALPLYPNIYTMSKYTGESLTTYEPGGPWGDTHRQLADAAPVHIDNVHILANLEPWRWASPAFTQKAVQAMHNVHHSSGLHLYPQAAYWDWPYTADKLADGGRLLQTERDWMWYRAWGRYAWNCHRGDDADYWKRQLADYYGISTEAASQLLLAYDETGEIAPKLLRRFGITEGNRQTLLLGMKMAQLVNPYKFNIYPGFYESCGPEGEKLIDFVEKEWNGQPHHGELPLDIVEQCVAHATTACRAMEQLAGSRPRRHQDEYERLCNDVQCYHLFTLHFRDKVLAARQVLNYKWTKDTKYLEAALPFLESSVQTWERLARLTEDSYLYANSMQTAQRRIPVGGDNGLYKTWSEMLPVYQEELQALKAHIWKLRHPAADTEATNIAAALPASVRLLSPTATTALSTDAVVFENRPDTKVEAVAPELEGLQALVLNRDTTRIAGTTITFDTDQPVTMLVGFFQDDDPKWAKPPKLETDATGNEYGQAEALITNAVSLRQMPPVNIHAYHFNTGLHTINLPRGIIMVAGFTQSSLQPRDAGLQTAGDEVDWLFSPPNQNSLDAAMQRIYEEVKTPYKYGLVIAPDDNFHKADCPTVFRHDGRWLMTYVVYNGKDGTDGRGYETWLAQSDDLLHWTTLGRVLSYAPRGWDMNQRGGFPALTDWNWGGTYEMETFQGRHWMTYIGGHGTGYEAVREPLNIGLAWTSDNIGEAHEWQTARKPLLSIADKDAQWWEQLVQYKSTVYRLSPDSLVMFYNAGGINPANGLKAERIGMAFSNDMKHWHRYAGNPVFSHESAGIITGDAQIARMQLPGMDPLYVMFHFKAFDPTRDYSAYNTFAVSRDLIHWQQWQGPDLIAPSKSYDEMFAHKSWVVKHQGTVYHFYCAVNEAQQRGIAVATSRPMGHSEVHFPAPEPTGRRHATLLDSGWKASLTDSGDTVFSVRLPHNFDDYYGYRQLRHGNLHGSGSYARSLDVRIQPGKRYFLQMEGVGTYATVCLNGHQYPRELVGRTCLTLDVTDALRDGHNDLQVMVDHPALQTESPWVCGGCSSEWGFSEGSQPFGIFRPVTLIETDEVRVEPFGVHIWNNAACDTVFIDTEVHNYSQHPQTLQLVSKLSQADGKQLFRLTEEVSLLPGETRTIRQCSPVNDPILWSTVRPYLHRLATLLKRDGKTTDDVVTPFGIRSVSWGRRFCLNGQPVFINGTCEYEHLLGQSHAFSREQIEARVKMVRQAGYNAFREAHQPHNLYYQQLLDHEGLLFWSQFSAHIWYDTPQFRDNFKRLLRRWVRERRNSPSLILWGLQNESVLPKDFAEECCDIIRQLDPTASSQRLITTCNGGEGTDWNVVQNWSGTYGGQVENYANELRRPDQLLNGEYGAWRTLDLHGTDRYSEESFHQLLQTKGRLAESARDSVCGHFQWLLVSHDNPGRVQPDGALRRIDKIGPINHKGLYTIWEEPIRGGLATPLNPLATRADSISLQAPSGMTCLYRINCGGDAYTDEYGQLWQADDSTLSHSWGQDFEGIHPYQASQRHIASTISGTKSDDLFQSFRYGRHRLWYDLPVPDGNCQVELYFTEPWHNDEGLRCFDVAINDSVVIDNLDPWAEAGTCGALKRTAQVASAGGHLRISFPEVKVGQAVICAIAVYAKSDASRFTPHTTPFAHRAWLSLDTDTIARLPKDQLPPETETHPATVYEPEAPRQWAVRPGLGREYALRFSYKNTTGHPVTARMKIVDASNTVLADRLLTFPATPPKFKMLSTTTGTQINAGTYHITIGEAEGLEFKNLEMQ